MKISRSVSNTSSKDNRVMGKCIKEVTSFLKTIGCRLKKKTQLKYEVMCGRENTGLAVAFWQDVVENNKTNYLMALMYFPIPCNDNRFFKLNKYEELATFPNVQVDYADKKLKALFFEFLCRSIFYFQSSKILRKWQCYNCGETGYEVFLDNGTVATFDAKCSEFRLLIVDRGKDVEGTVYDAQIDEHVLPVCGECRKTLGYLLEGSTGLAVDQVYFTRFLEKQAESGRVMVAA